MSRARRLIAVPLLCYYLAAHGLPSERLSTEPVGKELHIVQRLEDTIKEELAQRQPAQLDQAVSDESRVTLNSIKIQGASLLGNIELEASVSKFVGVALSYEQMFEVAMAVESYYRQHNYLARVVLPTQDISAGVLELEVIESVITVTEVDKKLEELPNTQAQMDALIEPQQGQDYSKNAQASGDSDVVMLLDMYQSRSTKPSVKSADLVAFPSYDVVSMTRSEPQKFPMWHEPQTRRRRFISDQLNKLEMVCT